jgi:hypothetical protein
MALLVFPRARIGQRLVSCPHGALSLSLAGRDAQRQIGRANCRYRPLFAPFCQLSAASGRTVDERTAVGVWVRGMSGTLP